MRIRIDPTKYSYYTIKYQDIYYLLKYFLKIINSPFMFRQIID